MCHLNAYHSPVIVSLLILLVEELDQVLSQDMTIYQLLAIDVVVGTVLQAAVDRHLKTEYQPIYSVYLSTISTDIISYWKIEQTPFNNYSNKSPCP